MCNLVTWGGNLNSLTQTQQKEDRKNRAVTLEAVHSWGGAANLEKKRRDFRRTNFLHSRGRDLVSTEYSTETVRVGAGAADNWLQFLALLSTQKTSRKTHHPPRGFCDVLRTREAVLRLQPQPKGRAGGAIAGFPPEVTVSSRARRCVNTKGVCGSHSWNN